MITSQHQYDMKKHLKYMAAMTHMSNRTDITVSMHTITLGIKILMNHVSAADGMIHASFHSYQLHLESLIVSESSKAYMDSMVCNNV